MMQKEKYFMDVVIQKETLSDGSPIYVSHCASLGIASQGKDIEEAIANIREAIELYLEDQPETYDELSTNEPVFSVVEVTRNSKVASRVR